MQEASQQSAVNTSPQPQAPPSASKPGSGRPDMADVMLERIFAVPTPSVLRPMRVLVVDESAVIRTIVSVMLETLGMHVVEAADGHAAVAAVQIQGMDSF